MKVWPRVTKGIPQVLRTTQPTSLIMGMRTMASVYQSLRSTFAAETAALFGFDTVSNTCRMCWYTNPDRTVYRSSTYIMSVIWVSF